ncbi:hypothetical protein GWI33_020662 [Rhynchophorus ferrugineus]|uniref:Uncharacterized protein n=1 Tax=Rhynchophorus ferrugineus TaxID=354439 RepID=A0A834I2S0_RHYFE|nr:hypothetical protein GWI33_020662 [Rhynchophorus ferrugineus]
MILTTLTGYFLSNIIRLKPDLIATEECQSLLYDLDSIIGPYHGTRDDEKEEYVPDAVILEFLNMSIELLGDQKFLELEINPIEPLLRFSLFLRSEQLEKVLKKMLDSVESFIMTPLESDNHLKKCQKIMPNLYQSVESALNDTNKRWSDFIVTPMF